ncbi:helix-turn-helix domain-containing protein [Marinomonas mediterranea]|jgi:Response regulator containing CheY-like receiver, AAA-type ATPase, and DNA-binding domains|uniref:Transcriptional regulator, AraC family n=1 Tax=Marinomonas mediterranea (strain ATCC 700492 / JCM 21426 / NBRC 103028 / MMB-1) TaxID=717774 RepID=F2JYC6_MARM1|nr:helix-turn-helix domain-containing protein [Marinomonas mediterranea]ADZ91957.1 transcriptional regulator, AraC family [Marinomonas mediterranea MMB-1]WCN09910.1 helix-turn-helix domain-containing protein [Marinomonas mediterranea]WCN18040.1 helix-turn-helix domain-containing protein [Marinomonas mediterranea MMB-1]
MNQVQLSRPISFDENQDAWVGSSSFIQMAKQQLKLMSKSRLPVFILGLSGTGKAIAAKILHDLGCAGRAPFVTVCCHQIDQDNLARELEEHHSRAGGGSLYIRNIELLSDQGLDALKQFWLRFDTAEQDVRLLVSSSDTKNITSVESGLNDTFSNWLYYHCLTIELPTLMNRLEDIEGLVQMYQAENPMIARLSFQSSAWDVLKGYTWPGNVKQLKRCLDKLAIQANSSIVNREVLLECFPSMATERDKKASVIQKDLLSVKVNSKDMMYQYAGADLSVPSTNSIVPNNMNPLGNMFSDDGDFSHHSINHPALNKAIVYLYHNYKKPLNMDELASQACISPSHLSYLFKHYLGMSFKQVLLRLRIVKAMALLAENPNRQVTQVCDDVGFSDLSFFVRKFKSTVGMSPGVYRDQYGQADSSPEFLVVEEALSHPLLQLPIRH